MLWLLPLAPLILAEPRPFNMPDLSARSAAGVEMMYGDMDIGTVLGDRNVDLFQVHLVGEFVVTPNLKLDLRMPFAWVDCEACFGNVFFDPDDDQLAVGNLTLGAHGAVRQGAWVAGGTFSYSGLTASDDPDDDGRAALLAGVFMLFRDAGWFLPNTQTLRFAGDVRAGLGRAFVQGQLALHQLIVDDDDDVAGDPEDYTILRLAAGGGFHVTPEVALLGEVLMTSTALDEDDDDNPGVFDDEEAFFVLDVGLRYTTERVGAGARLSIPLEYGNIEDPIGFGVDILARF